MNDRASSAIKDHPADAVIDRVLIGDRWFPVVALVCPQEEGLPERSPFDRSLGVKSDPVMYVPAENGVIFSVEHDTSKAARPGTWRMDLLCAACERSYEPDGGWMWLPISVWINGVGDLVAGGERASGWWIDADAEWVVETIDRLSRKPFTVPDGPRVQFAPRVDNGTRKWRPGPSQNGSSSAGGES